MISSFSTISAYPLFKSLTPTQMEANKAKYAKSAKVQTEVNYFKAKAAKVQTVDELLKDYRALKYMLTAYSMEDQLQYPARIKTILKDNAADSAALVNRMSSAGYREINAAFDFFKKGVANLKDSAFLDKLAKKYSDSAYELSLGDISPDLADAFYFQNKIGAVKNGYEVIGDKVLFSVIKTALNIPNAAAASGKVEKLKAWIERDLDFKRLNDATYIRKLAERFLVLKDVENRKGESSGLIDMFA